MPLASRQSSISSSWGTATRRAFWITPQPCRSGSLLRVGNLLQEVTAEGVIRPAGRPVGLTDKLRDEVQVPDRLEEHGEIPELLVDVDLLQVGLRQTRGIRVVIPIRPANQHIVVLEHSFTAYPGTPLVVLSQRELVSPSVTVLLLQFDGDLNVWVSAGRQAADVAHPAAAADCLLEAAARRSNVT